MKGQNLFKNYEKNLEKELLNLVNDTLDDLKKSIDDKTPEDTKDLLKANEIKKAKKE